MKLKFLAKNQKNLRFILMMLSKIAVEEVLHFSKYKVEIHNVVRCKDTIKVTKFWASQRVVTRQKCNF